VQKDTQGGTLVAKKMLTHPSPVNFPQLSTGHSYTVLVAQGTHSVGLVSTFPHINLVLVLGYFRKF
jgi:hypothetical protein